MYNTIKKFVDDHKNMKLLGLIAWVFCIIVLSLIFEWGIFVGLSAIPYALVCACTPLTYTFKVHATIAAVIVLLRQLIPRA